MSNYYNDLKADEVSFHIDFWEGTILAKMLEHAWNTGDMEQVSKLIQESQTEMFDLEYRPTIKEYKETHPLRNIGWNLDGVPF